jgi:pantoate--beta-alanine ligase
MHIVSTPEEMAARAQQLHRDGKTIGFVPTMGFLHAGHASLMRQLRPTVDVLVSSVYVNPLQFGPSEDLSRYPRSPEADARVCAAEGVDLLFMPESLYPAGFATSVSVDGLTEGLCGASRPGHFEGVATVVTRLFGITRCDRAIFGEKDFQQLQVIRRVVRDLALPVEVVAGELIRDDDGVALSSRNAYLSAEERVRARSLIGALRAMQAAARGGERRTAVLRTLGARQLDVDRLDYLEIRDADDLQLLDVIDHPARAFVAAFVGRTRLIDNVPVSPEAL